MFHCMPIVMFALIHDRHFVTVDSISSIRFSQVRISLEHHQEAKHQEILVYSLGSPVPGTTPVLDGLDDVTPQDEGATHEGSC